jgi:hypothetical protein
MWALFIATYLVLLGGKQLRSECRLENECEVAISQAVAMFKEDTATSEQDVLGRLGPMMGDQLGALSVSGPLPYAPHSCGFSQS